MSVPADRSSVETERERQRREYEERMEPRLRHHPVDRLPLQYRGDDAYWSVMLHRIGQKGASIPRAVGEAAWEGYDADGHGGQSCERLHQRGGFDLHELGYYLVRAVDEGRVEIRIVGR